MPGCASVPLHALFTNLQANQVLKKKSVLGVRRDVVAVLSLRARVGLEGMMEGVLEMEMVMKRVQLARHREVVKQ